MKGNQWRTLAAFLVAIVILVVLSSFIGIGEIIDVLSMADPLIVALIPLVAFTWIVAWGLLFRVVVGILDGQLSVATAVLIYTSTMFANNITPFGQAGGEPISAYLIASATDTEYETGLAAIASVDAIHFAPSISLAAIGLASFALTTTLVEELEAAATAVVALVIVIPLIGTFVWRYRVRVETLIADILTPVIGIVAQIVPNREPPERDTIRTRVGEFFRAVERVATDRSGLALSFVFATIGWVALSGILWTSLFALGYLVPFTVVLVVIPIGSMASITPLPGGLGGIEIVLVGLLVPLAGIDPATASAAVVLHRAAAYWLPTFVGGVVASFIGTDSRKLMNSG
jgi:uncharacterized protein (TIRG00374 family)